MEKALYSQNAIWVASYLGGPLAGCYLLSKNFGTLDKAQAAKNSFIIGIVATALFFLALLYIPIPNIPTYGIPLFYTLVIAYLGNKYQGDDIKNHVSAGGSMQSWWKVLGISIVCLLITIAYFVALSIVLP